MNIIDTHAHYDDKAFDEDRDELLNSLNDHGIEAVVNIGANMETSRNSIKLADNYNNVYAVVGVHPSDTAQLNEGCISELKAMCANPKVLAIGEIGLDYYWEEPKHDIQKFWFTRQIALAREVELPLVIHSRDASKDTLDIMKAEHARDLGGVVHCYSYSVDTAREYINMGYFFGIGGVLTFNNAKKLKEVVEFLPIDSIVLETDAPYLAPVPNRGKRNSSLNIAYVVEAISKIKGIDTQTIIDITNTNAKKLYNKMLLP